MCSKMKCVRQGYDFICCFKALYIRYIIEYIEKY